MKRYLPLVSLVLFLDLMLVPYVVFSQDAGPHYLWNYASTDGPYTVGNGGTIHHATQPDCADTTNQRIFVVDSGRGFYDTAGCLTSCDCDYHCTGALCEGATIYYVRNNDITYEPDSGSLRFSGTGPVMHDFNGAYVTAITMSGPFMIAGFSTLLDEPIVETGVTFLIGIYFGRKLIIMLIKIVAESNLMGGQEGVRTDGDMQVDQNEVENNGEGAA